VHDGRVRQPPQGSRLPSSAPTLTASRFGHSATHHGAPRGARSGGSTGPRSQFPAFVLDRGRYESFEASDPTVQLFPGGINNRGVIVGE
jgi:hypothetical protein